MLRPDKNCTGIDNQRVWNHAFEAGTFHSDARSRACELPFWRTRKHQLDQLQTHEFEEKFEPSSRDCGVLSPIPTARTARFIRAKSYCHHWRFPWIRACIGSTTSARAGQARDSCER